MLPSQKQTECNSAFNMNRFLFLLVLTIVLATSTTSVGAQEELKVGDSICVQGFIMDYFCIKIKNMLDNGLPTLKQPEQHSVHCLLDVGVCTNDASPFEVLTDPEEVGGTYTRGYRLTDKSKKDMIALGRRVGSCSTCDSGYDNGKQTYGLRAVMKGTVVDLNNNKNGVDAPPVIEVSNMMHSNAFGDDPCKTVFNMVEGVPSRRLRRRSA